MKKALEGYFQSETEAGAETETHLVSVPMPIKGEKAKRAPVGYALYKKTEPKNDVCYSIILIGFALELRISKKFSGHWTWKTCYFQSRTCTYLYLQTFIFTCGVSSFGLGN